MVRRLAAEFRANLRPGVVALALAFSFALTALLTVMSAPGEDHLYGAPLPVGRSDFDLLAGGRNPTFVPWLFALDVLITAVLLLFIARRRRAWGVALAATGGLVALLITFLMWAKSMHTVGLPLPAALDAPTVPPALIIWIDMLLWASALVFVIGQLIARLASLVRRAGEPSRP